MELEKQVCSLELAKKLKELGVKQESLFWWVEDPEPTWWTIKLGKRLMYKRAQYSAFTVAELGEMLPKELYIPYKGNSGKRRKYPQYPHCFFGGGKYFMVNYTGGNSQEHIDQRGDTEADARALMLIYLLENKLIYPATLSN